MATNSSTYDRKDIENISKSQNMSVDGSLIDKESPPPYVTYRKGAGNNSGNNFCEELKIFQHNMLTMLESWFKKQDIKFSVLIEEFNTVKTSIQFLSDKYDELEKKNHDTDDRLKEIEHKLCSMELYNSQINMLEAKLLDMEQKSRNCNLEICNLQEKRGENLFHILENISNIIKQPLSVRDIIAIHRVPQMQPTTKRPKNIVVKFTSKIVRDNFIAAVRLKKGITSDELNLQGTPQKIFINEHLTLQNKKLFRQARALSKENGYRFVWVKNGVVLVRKNITSAVFTIRSENDLSKLTPKDSN